MYCRCRPCDQRPIFCCAFVFSRLPSATSRTSPITSVLTCRSFAQFTLIPADFVLHVPCAPLLFGEKATLAPLQATRGARTGLLARLLGTQLRQPLGGV